MKRNLTERRMVEGQAARIELRSMDSGPELVGYGVVYNTPAEIWDLFGTAFIETWAPGAVSKTIAEADIRSLFNHDPNIVLGRNRAGTLVLVEDELGLRATIHPPASAWGETVSEAIRRGDVSGMSSIFQVVRDEWTKPSKRDELPQRTIREARLLEVGPVTFPAFESTSIAARSLEWRAADEQSARLFDALRTAFLAEAGMPPGDEERTLLREGIDFFTRWLERRDAPRASDDAIHPSPEVTPDEIIHLAEERARLLALLRLTL